MRAGTRILALLRPALVVGAVRILCKSAPAGGCSAISGPARICNVAHGTGDTLALAAMHLRHSGFFSLKKDLRNCKFLRIIEILFLGKQFSSVIYLDPIYLDIWCRT